MNLTVGRIALPDTDVSWDVSGDSVRVSGSTTGLSREAASDLRVQLLGYVSNPDEAFVPVVSDVEPEFDGFYRIVGANVAGDGYAAFGGITRWSVDLQRVQSFASPAVEVTTVGDLRQNVHGWNKMNGDPIPSLFLPGGSREIVNVRGGTKYPVQNVRGVVGVGSRVEFDNLNGFGVIRTVYSVSPRAHYAGSPALLLNGDPVVGRRTLPALDSNTLALTNGFVQCEIGLGTGSVWQELGLTLAVKTATDSAWTPATEYRLARPTGYAAPWNEIGPIRVLRNSPEVVSVRVSAIRQGYYTLPLVIDVTLRRGDPFVSCRVHRYESTTLDVPANVGVWSPAASGGTLTAGRYVSAGRLFASPQALAVSGGVFTPGGSSPKDSDWDFAIGGASVVPTDGVAVDAWRIYAFANAQQQEVVVP